MIGSGEGTGGEAERGELRERIPDLTSCRKFTNDLPLEHIVAQSSLAPPIKTEPLATTCSVMV